MAIGTGKKDDEVEIWREKGCRKIQRKNSQPFGKSGTERHLPHGRSCRFQDNFCTLSHIIRAEYRVHLIPHVSIVFVVRRTYQSNSKTLVREINFELIKYSKSMKKRSCSMCRKTMKHILFGFLHHLNGYRRENKCSHIENSNECARLMAVKGKCSKKPIGIQIINSYGNGGRRHRCCHRRIRHQMYILSLLQSIFDAWRLNLNLNLNDM